MDGPIFYNKCTQFNYTQNQVNMEAGEIIMC